MGGQKPGLGMSFINWMAKGFLNEEDEVGEEGGEITQGQDSNRFAVV